MQQRRTAGPGSRGVMEVPAWMSGLAGLRHTWLAVCLLAAACGESTSPPEPVGWIRITSSTSGLSVDPDGYTVVLDESAMHPIQVNGTLFLEEVPPGNHTLRLAGVASDCRIEGQHPVTVVVNAGETTDASFSVTCGTDTALAFRLVSSGGNHTCGVTTEDKVYCWGTNQTGQLGVDPVGPEWCSDGIWSYNGCSSRPVPVLSLRFLSVSAGDGFTCGVTTDDRASCWGSNSIGQLGHATTSPGFVPVQVAGGLSFRQVSAGSDHTCGVTTDNRAYCWGSNIGGKLGDGTEVARSTPVAVAGSLRFQQVSAAGEHTCGITTDNLAFCWGSNRAGQLGDSTFGEWRSLPVRVVGGHYFSQIDAGAYHTCAVTPGSRAFCWGQGVYGQLGIGNGGTELIRWPMAVAGGLSFNRVTAGAGHTCGETTDRSVYCWGFGGSGQLGNGTTTGPEVCDQAGGAWCSTAPVAVVGGHSFAQVDAGGGHTCARTGANVAYCWGPTGQGLLGNGETEMDGRRATPTLVLGQLDPSATAQAR